MNLLTVYGRKEASIDTWPSVKKFDVQIYKDMECKVPYARFMWYQKKPIKTSKTVMLNCYKWNLVWVSPSEGTR